MVMIHLLGCGADLWQDRGPERGRGRGGRTQTAQETGRHAAHPAHGFRLVRGEGLRQRHGRTGGRSGRCVAVEHLPLLRNQGRVFGTILAELESGATILDALNKGIGGVIEEHFHHDRDITLARTKLWASHEAIRVAVGLYMTKLSERVVEAVVTGGRYDEMEARFIVAALVNGMLSAILSWQQDGASSSLEEYMDRGLSALARVFREN